MNETDDAKEYVATVGVISSIASGTEEPFFIIGLWYYDFYCILITVYDLRP